MERANEVKKSLVMKHRLRWPGHVERVKIVRCARKVLFSMLISGKRAWGKLLQTYKDQLNATLELSQKLLKTQSRDRTIWKYSIAIRTKTFEATRREKVKIK